MRTFRPFQAQLPSGQSPMRPAALSQWRDTQARGPPDRDSLGVFDETRCRTSWAGQGPLTLVTLATPNQRRKP